MNLSDPQKYILTSAAEINLFLAGVGSGKTFLDSIISGNLIERAPNVFGFIGANTYDQLNTSTMFRIRETWKTVFGWRDGIDYVVGKKPPAGFNTDKHNFDGYGGICSFKNGAAIFLGSLENAKAHDGKEFAWAILDETKDTREVDVKETILTRMRQSGLHLHNGQISQTQGKAWNPLYISTSPAKVEWLNKWFELDDFRADVKSKIYQEGDFFRRTKNGKAVSISSTYHNTKNLPPNFIDKIIASNSKDRANALIFADPYSRSGGEFYSGFDAQLHTGHVPYLENLPIHISFDQNVVPYITATLWQIVETGAGYQMRCFDEFTLDNPNNTTEKLCKAIAARWGERSKQMFYYGDASGHKRDTRSVETDYTIVARELRRWITNTSNRTNRSNPSVSVRRDYINAIFEGKNNNSLLVGLNCPKLIADLTYLKQDPNGNKLKEKAKDEATGVTSEKYGHTSDSMDYFITTVLRSEFERWQKQQ